MIGPDKFTMARIVWTPGHASHPGTKSGHSLAQALTSRALPTGMEETKALQAQRPAGAEVRLCPRDLGSLATGVAAATEAVTDGCYTKLSEHIRRSAPGELQCSVFCGGARCKYESGSGRSDRDKAIQGIYSH
ncbi:hypothetical protein IscW_ISCW014648, partial [Ixodes scapularis]